MPLMVSCPHCQKRYSAPDEAAGKRIKCPACSQVFPVSQAAAAPGPHTTGAQPRATTASAKPSVNQPPRPAAPPAPAGQRRSQPAAPTAKAAKTPVAPTVNRPRSEEDELFPPPPPVATVHPQQVQPEFEFDPGFAEVDTSAFARTDVHRELTPEEEAEKYIRKAELELQQDAKKIDPSKANAIGLVVVMTLFFLGASIALVSVTNPLTAFVIFQVAITVAFLSATAAVCFILVEAARDSVKEFALSYFVPFYILYFGFRNFGRTGIPAIAIIIATLAIMVLFMLAVFVMSTNPAGRFRG